jgi:PTS system nitrogen regulatory IIA component
MHLGVSDAARLLDTTADQIYAWIDEGSIPVYRVTDQYRFHRSELLEWATARGLRVSVDIFHALSGDEGDRPLSDALEAGGVHRDVPGADRPSVLRAIVDRLPIDDPQDKDDLAAILISRDASKSTVGGGVAVPHVAGPIVLHGCRPAVALAFPLEPIDFGAPDGRPIRAIFTILTPTAKTHLHLLSRLSSALCDERFRSLIGDRASDRAILETLAGIEDALGAGRSPKGGI